MKKLIKIIPILNILITICLTTYLLVFNKGTEKQFYIIFITGIIGFIFPLFTILITSIVELTKSNHKIAFILNIISILLNIFILYFILRIYDKQLLSMLIIYIITLLITIYNIIYLYKYNKEHKDKQKEQEYKNIKRIKKENNGVIK